MLLVAATAASVPILAADIPHSPATRVLPPDAAARLVAHRWTRLLGELTGLAGSSPPGGARIYAYAALAEYEVWRQIAAGGDAARGSDGIVAKLNGAPPLPAAPAGLDLAAAVAATYARMIKGLLPGKHPKERIQLLLNRDLNERLRAGVAQGAITRSVNYAADVSDAILRWARTDGRAEAFSRRHSAAAELGTWVPTPPLFSPPTDPFAGTVRTFSLVSVDEVGLAPPPPFSVHPTSALYQEARRVCDAGKTLTDEQRDTAFFWADATTTQTGFDAPGGTPGPAGHWLYNACSIELQHGIDPLRGCRIRASLAVAMHDAFTACWHFKFRHNLIRPETYINQHIDPDWRPMIMTPSFPEYPSGHSVVSHSAAQLLSVAIGNRPFTDERLTHLGIPGTRFASPHQAAESASASRLFGGLHFPIGITSGARLGQEIGARVAHRLNVK
ncbi:vanadium-dependent haloperoxidase [Micromonospora arborensis]|uniref:vanadium-dependent haloperoxidase n=1 Tax=Micromonospora arborensis TaxID=2116518 RepID=UPI00344677A0